LKKKDKIVCALWGAILTYDVLGLFGIGNGIPMVGRFLVYGLLIWASFADF
jgi:hypothetical protein